MPYDDSLTQSPDGRPDYYNALRHDLPHLRDVTENSTAVDRPAATLPPPPVPYVYTGNAVRVESQQELRCLPPGAIRMTRQEVKKVAERIKDTRREFYMYRRLEDSFDIWSRVITGISGAYIVGLTRHKYRLGRYHQRSVHYILGCLFQASLMPLAMGPVVRTPALLKEFDCPQCLAFRGGLMQTAGAVGYSTIVALVGALYYARRFNTVPLPPLTWRYARDHAKIMASPFTPAWPYIVAHSAMQFFFGYAISIKFWYCGQELNVISRMAAPSGQDINLPTTQPRYAVQKVETDWLTEFIARGGMAMLRETVPDDDEQDLSLSFVTYYYKKFVHWLTGHKPGS